jgi:spermidine/putrescine transport system permease protein
MGQKRSPWLFVYYIVLLVMLYLPIFVLFLFSVNDGIAFSFPMKGLTAHWYQDMLGNRELLAALRNSALVALGSSAAASLLGTAAAIALMRFKLRGRSVFMAVAVLPLLVPFLILGVALLILFSSLNIERSLLTIGIAHTIVAFPYALLILMARLADFNPYIEEAAQDLGATYFYTLRRVLLPILAPTILSAWLVAFTVSFDEYVLASFLNGGNATLPVYIIGQMRFANRFPQVIALAVSVMVISLSLLLIAEWLRRSSSHAPVEDRETAEVHLTPEPTLAG